MSRALLLGAMVAMVVTSDAEGASGSWIKWRGAEQDLSPAPGSSHLLHIGVTGLGPIEEIDYQLHYATPDGETGCVEVARCPGDLTDGCFFPIGSETVAEEPTIFGTAGPVIDGQTQILLHFPEDCGPVPMRFYLSSLRVVTAQGAIHEMYAGEEVTVWGGAGVALPPIVHEAHLTRTETGTTSVLAKVDLADPGAEFRFWGTLSGFESATEVEFFAPWYYRIEFPGPRRDAETRYLVVTNPDGRTSRFRIPLDGVGLPTHWVDPGGSGDFTSIGEAVAAAVDGDRILVAPGYYRERLTVDKSIRIESTQGPAVTVIDAELQGNAVTFRQGVRSPAALIGFTVRGGGIPLPGALVPTSGGPTLGGGGVRIEEGASVYVGSNSMTKNNGRVGPTVGAGGAIGAEGMALVEGNDLIGNDLAGTGSGIYLAGPGIVLENRIEQNDAAWGGGGGMGPGAVVVLARNAWRNNASRGGGGGLILRDGSKVSLVDNRIEGNTGSTDFCDPRIGANDVWGGGGVAVQRGVEFLEDIRGNEFIANSACAGGAIYLAEVPNRMIRDNLFQANDAQMHGGAIYSRPSEDDRRLGVQQNTFRENTVVPRLEYLFGPAGGGAIFSEDADLDVVGNAFQRNTVTESAETEGGGGALFLTSEQYSELLATANEFVDNAAPSGGIVQIADGPAAPQVRLTQNVFAYTQDGGLVEDGGGGGLLARGNVISECNVIWGNADLFDPALLGPFVWMEDPLYCDPEREDVEIDAASICRSENQPPESPCGDIGLAEVGCDRVGRTHVSAVDRRPGLSGTLRTEASGPIHRIQFELGAAVEELDVALYDAGGRRIRRLTQAGPARAGAHEVVWDQRLDDGALAPSGIYFLRVRADRETEKEKLVVVR